MLSFSQTKWLLLSELGRVAPINALVYASPIKERRFCYFCLEEGRRSDSMSKIAEIGYIDKITVCGMPIVLNVFLPPLVRLEDDRTNEDQGQYEVEEINAEL